MYREDQTVLSAAIKSQRLVEQVLVGREVNILSEQLIELDTDLEELSNHPVSPGAC